MSESVPLRTGFFTALTGEGLLLGSKCAGCGRLYFPPTNLCYDCFCESMNQVPLGSRGKLHSYTISHMDSLHFLAPYAIGWVDLPEGVMVFAPLKPKGEEKLRIGMDMELVIEKVWQENGEDIIGYKFQPC